MTSTVATEAIDDCNVNTVIFFFSFTRSEQFSIPLCFIGLWCLAP